MPREPLRRLTETGLALALVAVLNLIPPIFKMPQGGSVTAGSMVPIFFVALRWGGVWGILTGALGGLINYWIDPQYYHPLQWVLDYPVAFGALGIAGFLRRLPVAAIIVGGALRFGAHVLSGVVFFASFAPKGMSPLLYSTVYNGSFMLPEVAISVALTLLLLRAMARLTPAMR
ncbi:MAG TPA: energy-coupled thiamine transporter ThiT [bacterium]|jgi:thiamine transporter|nr:energy-coupled thiamine transporter ThiT [bacterium]